MITQKPTWKTTLYQGHVFIGHIDKAIEKAKLVNYQYVCFNGIIWDVESGEKTKYTIEDLNQQIYG